MLAGPVARRRRGIVALAVVRVIGGVNHRELRIVEVGEDGEDAGVGEYWGRSQSREVVVSGSPSRVQSIFIDQENNEVVWRGPSLIVSATCYDHRHIEQ